MGIKFQKDIEKSAERGLKLLEGQNDVAKRRDYNIWGHITESR